MSLANAFKSFTELITGKKGAGGVASAAASGMGAVTDAADNASSAVSGTGGAAKKAAKDIKGMSTGIDELNIINPDTGSGGGGSGSGAGADGSYAADEFDMGQGSLPAFLRAGLTSDLGILRFLTAFSNQSRGSGRALKISLRILLF